MVIYKVKRRQSLTYNDYWTHVIYKCTYDQQLISPRPFWWNVGRSLECSQKTNNWIASDLFHARTLEWERTLTGSRTPLILVLNQGPESQAYESHRVCSHHMGYTTSQSCSLPKARKFTQKHLLTSPKRGPIVFHGPKRAVFAPSDFSSTSTNIY